MKIDDCLSFEESYREDHAFSCLIFDVFCVKWKWVFWKGKSLNFYLKEREEGKWEKVCDYLGREWKSMVINSYRYRS